MTLKGSVMMKRAIIFLLHIPLAIFILIEYFMFMWFWGGDGAFAFFGCGISYIVYLIIHSNICKNIILFNTLKNY